MAKEMSRRERLLTAIRRGVPDRVPLKLWGVNPYARPDEPSYQVIYDLAERYADPVIGWGIGWGTFCSATQEISWEHEKARETFLPLSEEEPLTLAGNLIWAETQFSLYQPSL